MMVLLRDHSLIKVGHLLYDMGCFMCYIGGGNECYELCVFLDIMVKLLHLLTKLLLVVK